MTFVNDFLKFVEANGASSSQRGGGVERDPEDGLGVGGAGNQQGSCRQDQSQQHQH